METFYSDCQHILRLTTDGRAIGVVTEQLAYFTGPTTGGLLNATEVIISVFTLRKRLMRVVHLSLLGSILSNMLLVPVCSFFVGSLTNSEKDQKINKQAAGVSIGLLLMTCMGLLFPAVLHATGSEIHESASELTLFRFISRVLVVAYEIFLYFQLRSNKIFYEPSEGEAEEKQITNFIPFNDKKILSYQTKLNL
ncbi:hypothetical protein R1flu_009744 [Riccia fluitans]|uniref:Sodium/calcium exchanger membrane region domain-containing protein n=1 Tax=Riccia fluitans TaxID=41844 RepID=A0ABD1Z600_9MARC